MNKEHLEAVTEDMERSDAVVTCSLCVLAFKGEMVPNHNGSRRCESGSIASGGMNSHCTCGVCF